MEEVHDLMEVMTGSPMRSERAELKRKHTVPGDGLGEEPSAGPVPIEDMVEEAGGAQLTSKVSTNLDTAAGLTSLHADCHRCHQRRPI